MRDNTARWIMTRADGAYTYFFPDEESVRRAVFKEAGRYPLHGVYLAKIVSVFDTKIPPCVETKIED